MPADPTSLTALGLLAGYRARTFSASEVVEAHIARVEQLDAALGAFTTTCFDGARRAARDSDRRYERGGARPLEGVPFGAKDLFDTAGIRTTYGSSMFASHVPRRDAHAVASARSAGAVMLGKTLTHEFAWGITGTNPHFGSSPNPWCHDRISGGSSGGSGIAVATEQVPLALGTDTGGSVRNPAAFCGVVGFKPTFGTVSTDGLFPLAPSLDHVGVLARTPGDAGLFLDVLASGPQRGRRGVCDLPEPSDRFATDHLPSRLRVGLGPMPGSVPLQDSVSAVVELVAETLAAAGASVAPVAPVASRELQRALAIYTVVHASEAIEVHRRAGLYPARRDEYGPDILGRLDAAARLTDAEVRAADDELRTYRRAFHRLFENADVLMAPVSPIPAPPRGSETAMHDGRETSLRDLILPFTVPQDLSGCPACAVRAGFSADGLPIGLQFTAPYGSDDLALGVAQLVYEATSEVQRIRPEHHDS